MNKVGYWERIRILVVGGILGKNPDPDENPTFVSRVLSNCGVLSSFIFYFLVKSISLPC